MAVRLRLRRMGRKKRPVYGIVAADARSPRDGRYIEDLGRYYPVEEPAVVKIDAERVHHWLDNGAQPSDTVRNLLSREGILLERHLRKGGKSEEEIAERLSTWRAQKSASATVKETAATRQAAALAEEAKRVAKEEESMRAERAKAEAEAAERAKVEAEASRKKAEAELAALREKSAEEARADQADANVEGAADAATPAEAAAEEAVVIEPAPEAVDALTGDTTATEEAVEALTPEAPAEEAVAEEAPAEAEAEEAPAAEPEAEEAPAEAEAEEAPAAEAQAEPEAAEEAPAEAEPEAAEEAPAEAEAEPVVAKADAKPDKLTKLWGIGPKFAGVLNDNGITTFAALADTDLEALRGMIEASGIKQSIANEETWAEQAKFAAADDWDGLDAHIQKLKDS